MSKTITLNEFFESLRILNSSVFNHNTNMVALFNKSILMINNIWQSLLPCINQMDFLVQIDNTGENAMVYEPFTDSRINDAFLQNLVSESMRYLAVNDEDRYTTAFQSKMNFNITALTFKNQWWNYLKKEYKELPAIAENNKSNNSKPMVTYRRIRYS